MTTPEKKVKNRVTAILKEYGAYHFYPLSGGFSAGGVPDIIACYRGRFIGIECKAGKNVLSALQRQNIERINHAQGHTLVIREDNVEDVTALLETIRGNGDASGSNQCSGNQLNTVGTGADEQTDRVCTDI